MNSVKKVNERLLKLYPVSVLKDHFKPKEKIQELIIEEVVAANATPEIYKFAFGSFNGTKQHIHMLQLGTAFNKGKFDKNAFPIPIHEVVEKDGSYILHCNQKVVFDVIVENPLESVQMNFIQPIVISLKRTSVVVQATILESSLISYFNGRSIIRRDKPNEDAVYLGPLAEFFTANNTSLEPQDLHKGVKYLWDNDFIDSTDTRSRKAKSIAKETMDENFLFKKTYPDEYKELIKRKLEKTMFKYLMADGKFCTNFSINPSTGQITIPKFPKNVNQIPNVIGEILRNN